MRNSTCFFVIFTPSLRLLLGFFFRAGSFIHVTSRRPTVFPPINRPPDRQLLPDLWSSSFLSLVWGGDLLFGLPSISHPPNQPTSYYSVTYHHPQSLGLILSATGFQPPIKVPRVPPAIDLETFVSFCFRISLARFLSCRVSLRSHILIYGVEILFGFRLLLFPFFTVDHPSRLEGRLEGVSVAQRMLIVEEDFRGLLLVPPLTG